MPWSPNPTIPPRSSGGKWSPNPVAPPRTSGGKWHWVPRLGATDTGIGEDSASLLAHLTATDNSIGEDRAL
ncbi:hypothetical protein PP334_19305, partial [Mycobacteroides abscessus]|nr:hypothetical protein [Mycobacteroides abscessus]